MHTPSSKFIFKHAIEPQRDLIHRWLQQDYIRKWIHGKGLQNTLIGLEKFFQYQVQGQALDYKSKITHHWLGYDGDKPFVYLLTSNILKDTDDEYAKYCEMPGLAITLDIFIGDPEYVGKGLATLVIREFLLSQFSDVSEVFIDPEKTNERAVHVYQKVGFCIFGEFIAAWHPVPHYRMRLDMKDIANSE